MKYVVAALAAALLAAAGPGSAGAPTYGRTQLTVALHLPDPGFQVGAVRGRDVVAARGLEVDLARALGRQLGIRDVRLVHVPDRRSLTGPGAKPWDLALSRIDAGTARPIETSAVYLRGDAAVLLRPGLARPRGLADLRLRVLCVTRGSDVRAALEAIAPASPPLRVSDDRELLGLVQTGRCDAAVREAPLLGAALRRLPGRYGPVAGRVVTDEGFVAALPRGSELVDDVDRALARLRADGTLRRIAERWLGFDPVRLRVLH
jgi:polar amino acid transport system substrate-binding protein